MNLGMKNKIKAVIFDLDGTIINSEPNYYLSDKRLLEGYNIKNLGDDFKKQYIGVGSVEMMTDIKSKYNISDNIDVMLAKKDQYYLEVAKENTEVFPEMKNFLEILKNNNYPMAIASGSSRNIIGRILKLTNLEGYFDAIVSSEEVTKGKPDPEIFFEAAKRLKVSPENCLVIEDSAPGIKAAKLASMYCIGVPDKDMYISDEFILADLLFNDSAAYNFTAQTAYEWLTSV